jgi:TPR repeat protein
MHASSSSYRTAQAQYEIGLALLQAREMYPPPHMTYKYPPPHMKYMYPPPQAQYEIGLALLQARAWGTEPNVERAVSWLQVIIISYVNNDFLKTELNIERAVSWLRVIIISYVNNDFLKTELNIERAVSWLQRAADAEHIDAMVSAQVLLMCTLKTYFTYSAQQMRST